MRNKSNQVLLLMACLLYGFAAHSAEGGTFSYRIIGKSPDIQLQQQVLEALKVANQVVVKFRAAEDMHPPRYTKERAEDGWRYEVIFRCTYTCEGALPVLMQSLASGRKIDGECPNGFTVLVDLRDRDRSILKAYASLSGECMTLGTNSYIVSRDQSLDGVMRKVFAPIDQQF